MKKLLFVAVIMLYGIPLHAQLNCSGGLLPCSSSVTMSGGVTGTIANLGIGTAADAVYFLNLNGSLIHSAITASTAVVSLNTTTPTILAANITTLQITGGSADNTVSGGVLLASNNAALKGAMYFAGSTMNVGTITNQGLNITTNNANRIVLGAAGSVSVNTTGTVGTGINIGGTTFISGLTVEGGSQAALCRHPTTFEVQVNTGVQTCTVSSLRFKDWVRDLTCKDADRIIKAMRPGIFRDKGTTDDRFGFAAEWTNKVEPMLVNYEADNVTPRAVDYERYTAVLTKRMQCKR